MSDQDPRALIAEVRRLRAALQRIKDECGAVCELFEICAHPACDSSAGAWMLASEALGGEEQP